MNDKQVTYPIDEFASYEFKEDKAKGEFVITLRGESKYANLIADKIGALTITDDDLKKWEIR